MTLQIDLPAEMEARLREEAAQEGQDTADYVKELVKRQLVLRELEQLKGRTPPHSLAELKARVPTPPGTTWLEALRGHWPGDESDEEIERALNGMS